MNDNLNMEKFSPKKAELTALVEKNKGLTIDGVDDEIGYDIVKSAKKKLAKHRTTIKEIGLKLRREALDYQNKVIAEEKGLLGIFSEQEEEFKTMLSGIDHENKLIAGRITLPSRIASLKELDAEVPDEELLLMEPGAFRELLTIKKEEFLEKKAEALRIEGERLEQEKRDEELKKEARIEAEKQAKVDADKREQDLKDKAEAEKQEVIDKAEAEKQEILDKAEEDRQEILNKAEEEKQALIEKHEDEKRQAEEPSPEGEAAEPEEHGGLEDTLDLFLFNYLKEMVEGGDPRRAEDLVKEFLNYLNTKING